MTVLESTLKTTVGPAVNSGALPETTRKFDTTRRISPAVAHELNNIIAIIQGYADRLRSKNSDNPALEPHLKLISDAAKRAAGVVRDALPHPPAPDLPAQSAASRRVTAFRPDIETAAIRFDALRLIA